MFNKGTTDSSRIGRASGIFAGAPLKLMVALAGAMLMLFLVAGPGDMKPAYASNSAPVAQSTHVLQDACGIAPAYGFGYGFNGYMGYAPWWNQGYMPWNQPFYNCAATAPVITSSCAPVPGAYTCGGYCGDYWSYYSCAPACYQYSCAPNCVQSYYSGYTGYDSVPCSLPVDRISFVNPPLSMNCGASADLTVMVWDTWGNPVVDGTSINFASSLGGAMATGTTTSGKATVHMTAANRSGLAQITAASGGVEGSTIIMVNC